MGTSDVDQLMVRIADTVVAKLDERRQINIIAQAIVAQIQQKQTESD